MVFAISFDLATPAGLKDLNTFLQSRSYLVGYSATQADVALYTALGKAPDANKFPNVARFYSHIASLKADARAKLPAAIGGVSGSASAAPAAAEVKPAAGKKEAAPPSAPAEEEDTDADLFGDDEEKANKASASAAVPTKVAAPAPAASGKKEKKPLIDKTSVIYEVKPLEAGQDMKEMESRIRAIEMDGLVWGGEFKIVDVAYGIQKLVIQMVIEDEKVGLQDIEEKIEAMEDIVQSIDMLSMTKV